MAPRISVCIPAYNHPDKLRRALQSIELQHFKDYEVVVTDDSSNDAVEQVAHAFGSRFDLRYKKNVSVLGTPENWNEAVRLCSGDYIKLLHHDDWFCHQHSLAAFANMLDADPRANFAFSSSIACDPAQNVLFVHTPSKSAVRRLRATPKCLLFANYIGSPSATIYRRAFLRTYDPRLKWLVDVDFYIRMLNDNNHFIFSPSPLVSIEISRDSVTASCLGIKSIELFEYLHLLTKHSAGNNLDMRCVLNLWRIFIKYSVTTRGDLLDLGVDLDELPALDRILFMQRVLHKVGLLALLSKRRISRSPQGRS